MAMTNESWEASRAYIEDKMVLLMDKEQKPIAKVAFASANYRVYVKDGRTFFYVRSNIFKGVFENDLLEARDKFPDDFGTGDAHDVVEALKNTVHLGPDFETALRLLKDDTFAVVIETKDGKIEDKCLRLDLFRDYKKQKGDGTKFDFIGGVMHAMKHFSCEGKPLCTGNENHEIKHPLVMVEMLIEAFFMNEGEWVSDKDYECYLSLDEEHYLKLAFFLEKHSGVFFLNTMHKIDKTEADKQRAAKKIQYEKKYDIH